MFSPLKSNTCRGGGEGLYSPDPSIHPQLHFPGQRQNHCYSNRPICPLLKTTTGHKSHKGQKKCFTSKYREKCIYFVLTEHTLYYEHLTHLTGGNWQKWKRVFLTCPCHEIYRNEAVGLKSCKNTWKITIFVKMWNLGQYLENLIFCQ